jgi:hypothetical protein
MGAAASVPLLQGNPTKRDQESFAIQPWQCGQGSVMWHYHYFAFILSALAVLAES